MEGEREEVDFYGPWIVNGYLLTYVVLKSLLNIQNILKRRVGLDSTEPRLSEIRSLPRQIASSSWLGLWPGQGSSKLVCIVLVHLPVVTNISDWAI
jgi:hypothetical protein